MEELYKKAKNYEYTPQTTYELNYKSKSITYTPQTTK